MGFRAVDCSPDVGAASRVEAGSKYLLPAATSEDVGQDTGNLHAAGTQSRARRNEKQQNASSWGYR